MLKKKSILDIVLLFKTYIITRNLIYIPLHEVTNSWYKLLEEVACLQHKTEYN